MALDRQSIERKDFPVGQRGYDPEAVDAHLSALADEVDELRLTSRRRSDAVASSTSEQVRAIVEAAERGAAEIQRQAEDDARDTREEAARDARAAGERADGEAREHVGRVTEATDAVLARLDRMEHELGGLIDALRAGGERIEADISQLRGDLGAVSETVSPSPQFEPEQPVAASYDEQPAVASHDEPAPEYVPGAAHGEFGADEPPMYDGPSGATDEPPMYDGPSGATDEPPLYDGPSGATDEPPLYDGPSGATDEPPIYGATIEEATGAPGESVADVDSAAGYDASAAQRITAGYGDTAIYGEPPAPYQEPVESTPAAAPEVPAAPAEPEYTYDPYAPQPLDEPDDTEGARLIALNMALNGTPRDETERYLTENFKLPNARGLLDEVYASVEG
ncbi:MAG: hypothetical protein ACRDMX_00830 [Solirubrobacteraceae bacterium]